eukprot:TRINITY_DN47579_c0_g1_i1.p2 TRINITY_DN47579_c0_g1~~TRINITY_DN47579_c0_g1_i1.p2  ORF type:complete len:116 (-),score=9.46 TRINITY_DN47579_c0_g1_i1:231-578(-)
MLSLSMSDVELDSVLDVGQNYKFVAQCTRRFCLDKSNSPLVINVANACQTHVQVTITPCGSAFKLEKYLVTGNKLQADLRLSVRTTHLVISVTRAEVDNFEALRTRRCRLHVFVV